MASGSTPERRDENMNVRNEWGSNPQPFDLQAHFVPLRHDWPQIFKANRLKINKIRTIFIRNKMLCYFKLPNGP